MFQGQFDLEDQGQGHQSRFELIQDLYVNKRWFNVQFQMIQKLPYSQSITQTDDDYRTKNNMSLPVGGETEYMYIK